MKHIDILGSFEAQRAFFGSIPLPRGIKEDKMIKKKLRQKKIQELPISYYILVT